MDCGSNQQLTAAAVPVDTISASVLPVEIFTQKFPSYLFARSSFPTASTAATLEAMEVYVMVQYVELFVSVVASDDPSVSALVVSIKASAATCLRIPVAFVVHSVPFALLV